MKILYLLGCNEGPSKRYRVFNHIEALKQHGIYAEWVWDIHPQINDDQYIASFSIVVAFRSGYNDRVVRFFDRVKSLGIPLVFDIDDLVFDPDLVDQIDAYRLMDSAGQDDYLSGVRSISRALLACQYHTTSTSFLAGYIEHFTRRPTWIVPFGVNDRQVEIAGAVEAMTGGPRFIGYLSGTKTHQRDFAEAAPALRRILADYDDVYLKLIGFLDVEEHLPGLAHKVHRLEFMDWQDLVVEAASLYVNIAPFEEQSLFCQAKSQLKFVEAALCGVPTVSSRVPSFVDSIESGVNGYLASSPDDWHEALSALLDDPAHRDDVGMRAHRTCQRIYFPKRIGRTLVDTYRQIIDAHAARSNVPTVGAITNRRPKSGLRITWLIPQPFEGSGGHRNIFRAIRFLGVFGHMCTVHVVPDNHRFADGGEIDSFVTREFFDLEAEEVILGTDAIEPCDILVCTWWTTAYIAKANRTKAATCIYFLQDIEPMFYPMGTDYVRAMATYGFGFHFITSGPWPMRMLGQMCGIEKGDWFRFPIDRKVYFPAGPSRTDKPRRIAFFARPNMPRRCYPLGVAGLAIVKARHPDVEIVFYGDRRDDFTNIPFEFTNLGLTDTIDELGDLYRSADVGVCFSTTNPSLVPFEMMACGCPVVDLAVNGNEVSYGSVDNCVLVAPDPESIADGICAVLEERARAARLSANGLALAKLFPSEEDMCRLIESFMLAEYRRGVGTAANTSVPKQRVRSLESQPAE